MKSTRTGTKTWDEQAFFLFRQLCAHENTALLCRQHVFVSCTHHLFVSTARSEAVSVLLLCKGHNPLPCDLSLICILFLYKSKAIGRSGISQALRTKKVWVPFETHTHTHTQHTHTHTQHTHTHTTTHTHTPPQHTNTPHTQQHIRCIYIYYTTALQSLKHPRILS